MNMVEWRPYNDKVFEGYATDLGDQGKIIFNRLKKLEENGEKHKLQTVSNSNLPIPTIWYTLTGEDDISNYCWINKQGIFIHGYVNSPSPKPRDKDEVLNLFLEQMGEYRIKKDNVTFPMIATLEEEI